MQRLGQHFLKNPAVIQKIITALDLQPGEVILEVGPGHGELTLPLITACKKIGAKIITVEKDAKLAKELEGKIGADGIAQVINDDILEFLKSDRFTHEKFKLAGNIPYYLTGHLLRIISERENKPERAVIMIQKEVAERISAKPPKMNRLAASVGFWAIPSVITGVPRSDFTPPPEVDSAVIELRQKKGVQQKTSTESERYYATMRGLFAQPRKTVLNNLLAAENISGKDKASIETMLANLAIDPKSRPQDLTIEKIAAISSVHK